MATFCGAKNSSQQRTSIYNEPAPQSEEGVQIVKTLKEAQEKLEEPPIQRLVKKLEARDQRRCQELQRYIENLRSELRTTGTTEFTEEVLDLAWQVWERLKLYFESRELWLEVPDASPGSQNNFMYAWTRGDYYLECEIFGTGAIEFFYRDDKTDRVWGEDTTLELGFSSDVLAKVQLFTW